MNDIVRARCGRHPLQTKKIGRDIASPADFFICARQRMPSFHTREPSSALCVQHIFIMLYLFIEPFNRRIQFISLGMEPGALLL